MGKKKKRQELKPFCYYCDREFDEEKVLIQHQKAKHFKCPFCTKRLGTVSGMVVHAHQVHKAIVDTVPNAKEGRDSIEIDIVGMDGVPPEYMQQMQERVDESNKRPRYDQDGAPVEAGMPPMPMAMPVILNSFGQPIAPPGGPPPGYGVPPPGYPAPPGAPPPGYPPAMPGAPWGAPGPPVPPHTGPPPPWAAGHHHPGGAPPPGSPYGYPPSGPRPGPPYYPPGPPNRPPGPYGSPAGPYPPPHGQHQPYSPRAPYGPGPGGHTNGYAGARSAPPAGLGPQAIPVGPDFKPLPSSSSASPANSAAPLSATNAANSATVGQSTQPSTADFVYRDETLSMEEKRAQLPRYQLVS